jgi:predicted metal-dependent peptidase
MDEELIQISEEIFAYIRSQLTFHLRFMDLALNNYQLIPDALEYRCDGKFFHYPPIALIKTFQNNPNEMVRGYLHVVLHSVFQHLYFSKNRRMSLWNLAADIAVENVIEQLGLSCAETPASQEKQRQIAKIREKVPEFTAQKIYHYLEDLETDQIKLLAPVFYFDNHECWYEIRDSIGTSETLYGEENRDNPSASGGNRFEGATHDTGESQEGEDPHASEEEIRQIRNALKDWKEISEKIETDLETFNREEGEKAEAMVQSLKALHREKYSYRTFLRKFMSPGEKMKISDEDFDLIFYTYGLNLYRNLPLIEPLEYQEMNNIRELVIAIDTSGSVQGDIVQDFLQKTYNIFQEKESFFSHFRIHILQCDMMIRDTAVITTMAEFEKYIETMEIKGLGGTDFRPVFSYVNEQIEQNVFRRFGGLLYFTDGDGVYPKYRPSYQCAFLFPKGNKEITVPPWAIRYSLEED